MAETGAGGKPGYLVMARKWRPSTFADVVGQQHIVRALSNAVAQNRIAGAYLFSGTRGVGKTSMARIFARSINCEKGPTLTPCGECRNCVEIADGGSIDVVEIDGASNNGVDNVREIRDHLQYAPVRCRNKIYIIDEVHMLSTAAFNAFLKTLEEPPPHTVFIMATTEQHKLPETVLSRCQCFEFRALSDAQIFERLQLIAQSEKLGITDGALMMIARRAEGSMRDGQSLLDQAAAYGAETIDETAAGLVLGLISREKVWALLSAALRKDVDAALAEVQALYYSGFDVGVIIRELFEAVRALTIAKVSGKPEKALNETPDALAAIKAMVRDVSAGRLQQCYEILLRAKGQSAAAGNALSVLEMALIKMVRLDDVVPVDEILKRLQGAPAQPAQGFAPQRPSAARQEPAAAFSAAPAAASGGDPWEAAKAVIAGKKPLLGSSLNSVTCSVEGDRAALGYPEEQSFIKMQIEENRELIEAAVAQGFGRRLAVSLAPRPKGEGVPAAKKAQADNALRRQMLSDPIVQKATDLFGGTASMEDDYQR